MSKLVTPIFRGAFLTLYTPVKMKDDPDAKKKYSVKAVFEPGADLTVLKKAAQAALVEKWGNDVPKNVRSPFRLNSDLDNPIQGVADDAVIVSFSAAEGKAPGVVGPDLREITDSVECYAGAYYRANFGAYAYNKKGNKGVAFGLNNIQKVRDGEPLDVGRIPAHKVFEPIEGSGGAAEIFS